MKLNNKTILGTLFVSILALSFAVAVQSASAQTPATTDTTVTPPDTSTTDTTASKATTAEAKKAARAQMMAENKAKLTTAAIARGDKEIGARITSLNTLMSRVGEMKRLTDTQKASINTQIQNLIGNLTSLKTKIDADGTSGTTTLKTDLQSITQLYRVYALVMPQINILAAVDRIGTISTSLNTIGTKISTRLTAAETAGKDVTAVQTTVADFTAKLTDANTQTGAAFNLIVPLVPDNGDATVAASNKTALTTARADIKTAMQDVQTAWKDASSIAKALAAMHLPASSTASSTTTTAPGSTPTQ